MSTTPVVVEVKGCNGQLGSAMCKGCNGQLGSAMSTTPIVVEVKGCNGQLGSAMATTPVVHSSYSRRS